MKQTYFPTHFFQPKPWANGTTTELVKYPPESDFLKRDFIFRISTATVEAEESTFSDFSGLTRILMVLEGSMTIIHDGRYEKQLRAYDQDTFDGSWSTRSIGKVRDFNLMYNPQARGEVKCIRLLSMEESHVSLTKSRVVLFVHTGIFSCEGQTLHPGDLLDLEDVKQTSLTLKCIETGVLICSEVQLY